MWILDLSLAPTDSGSAVGWIDEKKVQPIALVRLETCKVSLLRLV